MSYDPKYRINIGDERTREDMKLRLLKEGLKNRLRGSLHSRAYANYRTDLPLTERGRQFLKDAGLDPDEMMPRVQGLNKNVQDTLFPSQLPGIRKQYDELDIDVDRAQALANTLPVGLENKRDVFLGNYALRNVNKSIEEKEKGMAGAWDDLDYAVGNIDNYDEYVKYVQASMGLNDPKVTKGLYDFGINAYDGPLPQKPKDFDKQEKEAQGIMEILARDYAGNERAQNILNILSRGYINDPNVLMTPEERQEMFDRARDMFGITDEQLNPDDQKTDEQRATEARSIMNILSRDYAGDEKAQSIMSVLSDDTLSAEDREEMNDRAVYMFGITDEQLQNEMARIGASDMQRSYFDQLKADAELRGDADELDYINKMITGDHSIDYNLMETAGLTVQELIDKRYPNSKDPNERNGNALRNRAKEENERLKAEVEWLKKNDPEDVGIAERERKIAANERIIRDVGIYQLKYKADFKEGAAAGKQKITVTPNYDTEVPYSVVGGKAVIDKTWDLLKPEEQDMFAYLLEKDPKQATEYWDALTDNTYGAVTRRKTEQLQTNAEAFTGKGFFGAAAANLGATLTTPVRALVGSGYQAFNKITGKETSPFHPAMAPTNYAQAVRGKSGQMIDEATKNSKLGNVAAKVLYTAATSMGDSFMSGIFGKAGLAVMGLDSAQQTMNDALNSGATQEEAELLGGVTGSIEVLTEKLPFDMLLGAWNGEVSAKTITAAIKEALPIANKAGLTDSAGEMLAEYLGNKAEQVILQEKSGHNKMVEEYLKANPTATREQAEKAIIKQEWQEVAIAGLSGYISSGAATATGYTTNYALNKEAEAEAEKESTQEEPEMPSAEANYNARISDLPGTETAMEYALSGRSIDELKGTLQDAGIEVNDEVLEAYNEGARIREENIQKRMQEIEEINGRPYDTEEAGAEKILPMQDGMPRAVNMDGTGTEQLPADQKRTKAQERKLKVIEYEKENIDQLSSSEGMQAARKAVEDARAEFETIKAAFGQMQSEGNAADYKETFVEWQMKVQEAQAKYESALAQMEQTTTEVLKEAHRQAEARADQEMAADEKPMHDGMPRAVDKNQAEMQQQTAESLNAEEAAQEKQQPENMTAEDMKNQTVADDEGKVNERKVVHDDTRPTTTVINNQQGVENNQPENMTAEDMKTKNMTAEDMKNQTVADDEGKVNERKVVHDDTRPTVTDIEGRTKSDKAQPPMHDGMPRAVNKDSTETEQQQTKQQQQQQTQQQQQQQQPSNTQKKPPMHDGMPRAVNMDDQETDRKTQQQQQQQQQQTEQEVIKPKTYDPPITKNKTQIAPEYVEKVRQLNQGGVIKIRSGGFRSVSEAEAKRFNVNRYTGAPLSEKQQAAIQAVRKVAEKMHINIAYFESPIGKNGERMGANGIYDPQTNTVYLDMFAGKNNEQAIMRAAAHEFTHVIRNWSPDKYREMEDMLVNYYYSTGENTLKVLVQGQIEKAKAAGMTMSESAAMEEVVCDACEMMFADVDALTQIAQTDRTLFQKIGDWIAEFIDTIKKAMEGIRGSTEESRLLRDNREAWEKAQHLWYQALDMAGRNNPGTMQKAAQSEKTTQQRAPETKTEQREETEEAEYSLREFDDGTRFVDVQTDQAKFDGLTNAEMLQLAKKIIKEKFRGRIVGIDNPVPVGKIGANEYVYPSKPIKGQIFRAKMKAAPELDNLIDAGTYEGSELDGTHGHTHKGVEKYDYYTTIFKVGENYFEGRVNVSVMENGKRYFKDITKIKNITQAMIRQYGEEPHTEFLRDVSMSSISENTENVNEKLRFSLRDTEYKTDRQLLADALENVAADANEAQMLREYQEIAAKLDADERRVQEINARIRELRLEDPNTPEEQSLLEERKGLEKGITSADRRLFQMESLKPLQRIAKIQRKEAEEKLNRAKQHLERYKEGVTQREYIGKIKRTSDRLAKWLTKPSNQRFVPEAMRKPLAEFLLAIDRSSVSQLTGGGDTQEDRDYARVVADLRKIISEINKYQNGEETDKTFNLHIDLPRGFVEMMEEHANKIEARQKEMGGSMTLNRMNSEELRELFMTLTAISSSITHSNEFLSAENAKHVSEVAQDTIGYLREQKPIKTEGKIAEFLNWDNLQPIYAFERYGEGGKEIFKMLQDGQSKLAFNTREIVDASNKMYTAKEAREWSEDVKTFEINGKTVQIPVANIMSLYCLMRRQQSIGHLYGEGIRVGDFKVKGRTVRDDGHNVGDADIARMIGTLTERQKDVAEKLQRMMSSKGSTWGNEISMKRFGYRMFTEQNYFPIEVDKTHMPAKTDKGTGNELYRLLNISSTKPITRGANNRIMLNNIFDVYSSHMSDMAQYNAMALPVLDAVKWLNYKESELEDIPLGSEKEFRQKYTESVRDAARDAYGYAANRYIINVLRDINGSQTTGGTAESYSKMMLGRANRASVAANLRVAFLQPLSIIRAGMVLGTGDIIKGAGIGATRIRQNIKEMKEHSGIAAWKDLGFFDINIGRSVSKLIKHDESKLDKVIDASMKGAEWADKMTWALMWEGAKQAVAKQVSPGSQDYMQKVAEKFEEVVYKTQVVDSVLTKSQYMRNPSFVAKWTSSFMSEPTTTYNALLNAYSKFEADKRNSNFQQAWLKNKKLVLRTMAVYVVTAAVNAMVESLIGAWRDEDDYETFAQKFSDGVFDNFVNNLMPFNKVPVINDIYEYAKRMMAEFGVDTYGYSDSNGITQWLEQLESGAKIIADKFNGDATNYTDYGAIYKIAQGLSSGTGIPVASAMREVAAIWNNTIGTLTKNKIVVYKTSKSAGYKNLYGAVMDGDEKRAEQIRTELLEDGAEEKDIFSGLRSAAKEDFLAGDLTDEEAMTFLQKYAGMTEDEAYWKVEEWIYEDQEDENFSAYAELEEALMTGTGVEEAVEKLTSHGYTESKVNSKVREIIKDGYLAGELTQSAVAQMLKQYAGMTDNEVYFKQQQLDYERLTGDSSSSDACMIFYAIDQQRSPKKEIDAAKAHGKSDSSLASSITNRYKPQYLQLLKTNPNAAYALRNRLAGIFDYLGYKGLKKVDDWAKDNK